MTTQAKRKKRGRPALPAAERKLSSMGFRPTPALRADLERAAEDNGRSVSQEIQSRLERSFLDEGALGGPELYELFRILAGTAKLVEARTQKRWFDDWKTALAVQTAWKRLTIAFMPKVPAKQIVAEIDRMAPKPSEMPEPPKRPTLSGEDGKVSLASLPGGPQWAEYQKRLKKFDKELLQWKRVMARREKQQTQRSDEFQSVLDRLRGIEGIGHEAALDFLPERKSREG